MTVTSTRDRINVTVNPRQSISVITSKPKQTVLVNQSGVLLAKKLSDLLDVDISNKQDGSVLIYDALQEKFVASLVLEKQDINGGQF